MFPRTPDPLELPSCVLQAVEKNLSTLLHTIVLSLSLPADMLIARRHETHTRYLDGGDAVWRLHFSGIPELSSSVSESDSGRPALAWYLLVWGNGNCSISRFRLL